MLPNLFFGHQIILVCLLAFLLLFLLPIFVVQFCMINNTLLCCDMNVVSTKKWRVG